MPRNLIILSVLAVALFALSLAVEPTKVCSELSTKYKKTGDSAMDKFKVLVKEATDHPENLRKNLDNFQSELDAFITVGNQECNASNTKANFTLFMDLVEFSLKNATVLGELIRVKAFNFIDTHKENITACVNTAMSANETKRTVYGELYMKSALLTNDDHLENKCLQSTQIQNCTVNFLKNCDAVVANYVGSLFAFINSRICNNLPTNNNTESAAGGLDGSGFYGMLACGLLMLNI